MSFLVRATALALFACAAPPPRPVSSALAPKLDALFEPAVRAGWIPGAIVTVIDGDAVTTRSFGRATDTAPVLDYNTLLNGTSTAAGLKQIITERKAADNPDGKGLVTIDSTTTPGTVVVSNATSPLGITIGAPSSQPSSITVATPGLPAGASFTVASQPVDGDVVQLGISFPDGTTKLLTMTARSGTADPTKGEFQIGATTAAMSSRASGLSPRERAKSTMASTAPRKPPWNDMPPRQIAKISSGWKR